MIQKKTITEKKRLSLRAILIGVLTMAWLIPIAVFTWFIFFSYQKAYTEKTDNLMKNAVEVSGILVATDLDEAITKLQKPTYEGEWESAYMLYVRGNTTRNAYLNSIKASLISKYYMDSQFSRYAFYLEEDQTPSCYAGKNGYSYGDFLAHVQPLVLELAEKDSNYTEVHVVDNQIYVMRNLYTVSGYRRFGTLVLGLDKDTLFSELPVEDLEEVRIWFQGDEEYLSLTGKDADPIYDTLKSYAENVTGQIQILSLEAGNDRGYVYTRSEDNYKLSLFYSIPGAELYAGVNRMNFIAVVTVFCMIPLIVLTMFLLNKHLLSPLEEISTAFRRLREGEFGITLWEEQIPNEEFSNLMRSFNDMSSRLKHLFDTVYMERMATKDAQIEALQAQINPHFLNNTLEMMNWQSRMNGDIETSKMIEALGTVLDSGINRNSDRLVRLADEIHCGDAFLYIMSMRFGKRLRVEKEIGVDTMQVMVPQLILQPLLENAIHHGIEKVNSGTIWVKIYPCGDRIHIDVMNTGKRLSKEDMDRIDAIIRGYYRLDKSEPGVHTSIGIYNVNKRIQLIYGTDYGLTVFQEGELVTSRIVIPESFRETGGGENG